MPNLLEFANQNFKTFRRSNGKLNSQAGVIPEAFPIIREFMVAADKQSQIEGMKKFPGHEYYVKVMKGFLDHGREFFEMGINGAMAELENHDSDDEATKHVNIMREFLRASEYRTPPEREL
jgi:hypothetical protein